MIVETGIGIRNADAYVPIEFVSAYLDSRNLLKATKWRNQSTEEQESAIISATQFIDLRFADYFSGCTAVYFEEVSSKAKITFTGLPVEGDSITIGDITYYFVNEISNDTDVLINDPANSLSEAIQNTANRHVRALVVSGGLALTAVASGSWGDLTVLTSTATNVTINEFSGGLDGGPQSLQWPRKGATFSDGSEILGIPDQLKRAVAEFAVRSIDSPLMPDPEIDPNGQIVKKFEKVGPLEEETTYLPGTSSSLKFKQFPAIDNLLNPILKNGGLGANRGRVIRA